jgi:hypothetical protein
MAGRFACIAADQTPLRQAGEAYRAVELGDLRRSVRANLASFVGDLASQRSPGTSSSRDTARRRADQGVPLGSVLHAYRLGFHVFWDAPAGRALRKGPEWLDGLVRGSATVWAWVDTSSEAVNAEYRDALIESARHDEQQRLLLLDALHRLLGRVADLAPEEQDILLTTLQTWLECGGEHRRRRPAAVLPPQHRTQPAAPPRSAQRPVTQRSPRRDRPVHRRSGIRLLART